MLLTSTKEFSYRIKLLNKLCPLLSDLVCRFDLVLTSSCSCFLSYLSCTGSVSLSYKIGRCGLKISCAISVVNMTVALSAFMAGSKQIKQNQHTKCTGTFLYRKHLLEYFNPHSQYMYRLSYSYCIAI